MEYGCIGERLRHSFSKEIHARIGAYDYELKELAPQDVGPFLQERAFKGINVTIPYKQTVLPYLDEISDEARAVGAVNTIVNRDGRLYGYNTDVAGMTALLRRIGVSLAGKKTLVAGTGGTSLTAVAVAKALGASEVVRLSRTAKEDAVTYAQAAEQHADAQFLINATPSGMFPHPFETPVDLKLFPALEGVADAVYNPLRTKLVLAAQEHGLPAEGGLYMLVAQAVESARLFFGETVAEDRTDEIYREVYREKRNLVLIGMPGSGKSTIGRLLAQRANMQFLDTDDMIRRREGQEAAAIIRARGEQEFRRIESLVVCELALTNGRVIATGGGAVLIRNNVTALKMNGEVWFLERAVAELKPTDSRPLSDNRDKLNALWREREPLYRAAADHVAVVTDDPEYALSQIINGGKTHETAGA